LTDSALKLHRRRERLSLVKLHVDCLQGGDSPLYGAATKTMGGLVMDSP
jgi:hypothetical protein